MDKEIKAKWLAALRSGKYKQNTQGFLRLGERYCCLGVLCDVVGHRLESTAVDGDLNRHWKTRETIYECDGDEEYPNDEICARAGMPRQYAHILADMNDNGKTFIEIADYIEENL